MKVIQKIFCSRFLRKKGILFLSSFSSRVHSQKKGKELKGNLFIFFSFSCLHFLLLQFFRVRYVGRQIVKGRQVYFYKRKLYLMTFFSLNPLICLEPCSFHCAEQIHTLCLHNLIESISFITRLRAGKPVAFLYEPHVFLSVRHKFFNVKLSALKYFLYHPLHL